MSETINIKIEMENGGDTAVLLCSIDGSIALSPETKITGGGSLANLAAGAGTCAGQRGRNVGVDGAHACNIAAAKSQSRDGKSS